MSRLFERPVRCPDRLTPTETAVGIAEVSAPGVVADDGAVHTEIESSRPTNAIMRVAMMAVLVSVVVGCGGSADDSQAGEEVPTSEERQSLEESESTDESETPEEGQPGEETQTTEEGQGTEESPAVGDGEIVEEPYPVRIRDISGLQDSVFVEGDVGIVVRDGTRLSAKVFRPTDAGTYPVILALTAYGKDRGPDEYPAVLDNAALPDFEMGRFEVSPWTTWEGPDPATWVPEGYAVVYVDVRGYFDSDGDASVLSRQDAEDFHDVIEWAGAQEWSNGNVGTMGVSYLAISQWVAAGAKPPSLKAMIPWEGQTDSFREVLYHGGVPETAFTEFWLNRVNSLANTPPLPTFDLFQTIHPDPQTMKALQPETFVQPELAEVPALVAATWSDQGLHTRGSFEGFKQSSASEKWLFTHGRPKWSTFYGDEAFEYQLAFFDHFLKSVNNRMEQRPRVRLEVRETLDEYEVRFENEWPIARTEYRELYLDATAGELSDTQPTDASVVEYDPLSGAATFTVTFDEDTELTGNMKLRLWVSTSDGQDMDLFVGVHKLDTGGNEVNFFAKTGYTKGPVAMGWLRVSERALDEDRSTPWQPVLSHNDPQPLTRNEIVPVDIEILPSSTLFRAGESLRLVVQGSDLFEHPTLAHAYSRDVNVGVHTIHTGGEYDSHLLVPQIPG